MVDRNRSQFFEPLLGKSDDLRHLHRIPDPRRQHRHRGITLGPDGNIWFTESPLLPTASATKGRKVTAGKVVRLTSSGAFTEFPIRANATGLGGIITGPDCNLWIATSGANAILKMTTSGTVTEYPIPTADSHPSAIAAGADGAIWFTETGRVGRVTTSGQITDFPVPAITGSDWAYQPTSLAPGPDGKMWITEFGNWPGGGPGQVASISSSGVFSEYRVPTTKLAPGMFLLRDMGPGRIAAGPDDNLWFSNIWNMISVSTTGVFGQYIAPVPEGHFSQVDSMTAGPDGAIWFAGSDMVFGAHSATSRPLVGKLVVNQSSAS